MIPSEWLEQAARRISPHIRQTPLGHDPRLGAYIKWENRQVTGSFKARGALNKALALEPWERQAGLVAASAGNHGQGLALAGKLSGAPVTIFASETAAPVKLDAIRSLGAEVRLAPGGYHEAELAGMEFAAASHTTWVSPYNDGQVVAGQGTCGLEVLQQMPASGGMTWLAPVSGGGLIAGVAVALKERFPAARLVGVQAEASPFMHALFTRNSQEGVPDLPSLADGLTGEVEAASVTLPLVRRYVDQLLLVTEQEIAHAIAYAWHVHHEVIEGSGAVTLAAMLSGKVRAPALAIVSGGNIQPELHREICARYPEVR
ncbi:MAG: threonine/serine dehydratase [Chloroflexi bacterium]|nr:threonine/serine dehydratase [Chloroflexota bacterium]